MGTRLPSMERLPARQRWAADAAAIESWLLQDLLVASFLAVLTVEVDEEHAG